MIEQQTPTPHILSFPTEFEFIKSQTASTHISISDACMWKWNTDHPFDTKLLESMPPPGIYTTPFKTPKRINNSSTAFPVWDDFCVSTIRMASANNQTTDIPPVISNDTSPLDESEYRGIFEELFRPLPDMIALSNFTTCPVIADESNLMI